MQLLLDVGNTNIKIGLVHEEKILHTWRVATNQNRTADEYGMMIYDLLSTRGYTFKEINGIIISSVAPSLNYTLEHMCLYYFKQKPIMVTSKINLGGVTIAYNNPEELGADRIVNAVAAFKLYGCPCITVDFGSATTFGVVSETGEFLGGAISPGIKASAESLTNTTAKLPRIELVRPESVIGKNTITNMQSGIVFGFIGLVENIINQIKKETGYNNATVIATGGMSQLVSSEKGQTFTVIDRALSLKGLRILYELNKGDK